MDTKDEDLPKTVAAIAMMIPGLTLRTGWAYLKMKKRAQRVSKDLENSMVANGIPQYMARELATEFGEGLSVTGMMRMASRARIRWDR